MEIKKKLAGHPVDRMSLHSLAPLFKWPDNTFNTDNVCQCYTYVTENTSVGPPFKSFLDFQSRGNEVFLCAAENKGGLWTQDSRFSGRWFYAVAARTDLVFYVAHFASALRFTAQVKSSHLRICAAVLVQPFYASVSARDQRLCATVSARGQLFCGVIYSAREQGFYAADSASKDWWPGLWLVLAGSITSQDRLWPKQNSKSRRYCTRCSFRQLSCLWSFLLYI
jgi:hypothetical protein